MHAFFTQIKIICSALFCSVQMSVWLMLLYALVIGVATFIEKYYGTIVAMDIIYRSWWFEILNIWLAVLLLCCMVQSLCYGKFRFGMFLFHVAFVVALIGAAITRYYGFEGYLTLQNGEKSNTIVSREKFLNVFISDDITTLHENVLQNLNMDSTQGITQSFTMPLSPYKKSHIDYTLNAHNKALHIESTAIQNKSSEITENLYEAELKVSFGNETRFYTLFNNGDLVAAQFGNHIVMLSWGSKKIELPFSIELEKFHLDMYPGSERPSSYSSQVIVHDADLSAPMPYEIYMNHVLDFKGYRFFQESYTTDTITLENGQTKEEHNGTILSVNKDPGKIPTYIAYSMMIFGGLWLLFDKNGRFRRLGYAMRSLSLCMAFFFGISFSLHGGTKDSIYTKEKLCVLL